MLNVAENCIHRHVRAGRGDEVALIWEADEPGTGYSITFSQLQSEVDSLAAGLATLHPSAVVTIYMPMVPETVYVMLACARMGLLHNVVFGGFSAEALRDRLLDAQSEIIFTAEYGLRGGKRVELRKIVDEALGMLPVGLVKRVITLQRGSVDDDSKKEDKKEGEGDKTPSSTSPSSASLSTNTITFVDYKNFKKDPKTLPPPQPFPAEHPLFMLYTSGSTGKPKGLLHTTAGYLLYASFTARNSFDLHPGDVFGCLADVGWITGHSYIVYGPLSLGITSVLFESLPTYPTPARYW